jgi:ADP-heptose:LPS heptosyltransferase
VKVLIIRITNLIQTACSTAVTRAIKKEYPSAIIHYVCGSEVAEYLKMESTIDQIFELKADITPIVLLLLKEKYSHCIDLQNDSRSYFIQTYVGHQYNAVLQKITYPNGFWNRMFNSKKAYAITDLSSKMVRALPFLKLGFNGSVWPYHVGEEFSLKKDDLPMSHQAGYYTLVIDDVSKSEWYKNIIESVNFPVVLLANVDSSGISHSLKALDQFKVYDAIGKFKIEEQYNILEGSSLNIINNSYIALQAVATHRPLLQITGKKLPISDLQPYINMITYVNENEAIFDVTSRINGILKKA